MMASNDDNIIIRPMAMIGSVLCVSCAPGDKIFDVSEVPEKLLGIVMNGIPVVNHKAKTVYLSHDDYKAAKAALPVNPAPPMSTRH